MVAGCLPNYLYLTFRVFFKEFFCQWHYTQTCRLNIFFSPNFSIFFLEFIQYSSFSKKDNNFPNKIQGSLKKKSKGIFLRLKHTLNNFLTICSSSYVYFNVGSLNKQSAKISKFVGHLAGFLVNCDFSVTSSQQPLTHIAEIKLYFSVVI